MGKSIYSATAMEGVIVAEDLGGMSITNNAEAVVRDLVDRFGDLPIVYRDTDGSLDQLLHKGGDFTGFLIHGTKSLAEVLTIYVWP